MLRREEKEFIKKCRVNNIEAHTLTHRQHEQIEALFDPASHPREAIYAL